MPLQISLLGAQSIADDTSGIVRTRSARTMALVGFLVLHAGVPQTRQRLAGLFWPDSTDAQALTNLRRELHHLRRTLGDDPCLEVTAKDLCWRDGDTARVDVRTFEREGCAALAATDAEMALDRGGAALAAYGGELLPGLYDDWLLDARSELQDRCVALCALVCDIRCRRGELAGALEVARRRVRLAPLEEAGYRALMAVQADLGDRAGAVSTYHRCASVLERELGVVPDEATRATLQRVMGRRQATGGGRSNGSGPGRPGPDSGALVGRSGEGALLSETWRAAAAGRPGAVVVRGAAGVGKTRLVAELGRLARQSGALVAESQCFGTAGRLALSPVADWLRHPGVQSATASLEPVWRREVERLVPAGSGTARAASGTRAMVDAWQRHRFLEGLARAFLGVGRPTLLVLENLQWCDQETLAFLAFLLGLAPGAPVLLAATLRVDDGEDDPVLAQWLVRMRATGRLTEVPLAPLETADTARLAESIRGAPLLDGDRILLQAATGGFPLHVVEAMRTAEGSGRAPLPAGDLEAVLRRRLEQVGTTARELAGLAAAVGRDFDLDLLVEASDLDADSVVHAVDELWRLRIVHECGDGYDFSHDLLRAAAYERVSPPRRWLLHRRLAQGLELLHADDTGPVSAQLAEQYARGGRPERAVAYYRRAADVASGVFAHADAIRLHSAALAIVLARAPGRDRDRQELDVLEAMAAPLNARHGYSSPRLQAVLERSVELAESLGRDDSLLSGLVGLWASRFVQGHIADSHRTAVRALRLVHPGSDLGGAAHFACAGSAIGLGMPADALHHFDTAARLATDASLSVGTRPDIHGQAWSAHAHWLLGDDAMALSSCEDAVAAARSIDHPYSLAVALAYAGITHQLLGDRNALASVVTELRNLCDRYGFAYYCEWALVLQGWLQEGEKGITLMQLGIGRLRSEGSFARMPYWLSLLADRLGRTGQRQRARSILDAAAASAEAHSDVWWLPEVQRQRAMYDDHEADVVPRLWAAADLASRHGSIALLRRCEHDLAVHGVRPPAQPERLAR